MGAQIRHAKLVGLVGDGPCLPTWHTHNTTRGDLRPNLPLRRWSGLLHAVLDGGCVPSRSARTVPDDVHGTEEYCDNDDDDPECRYQGPLPRGWAAGRWLPGFGQRRSGGYL